MLLLVRQSQYSGVSHIRNCFLVFSLLFQNNILLFYPLFSQKLSVSVSYNVVSYMRDSIVSQLDKCLNFKSVRGDKNECTLYKMTPRNAISFKHLSSCGTILYTLVNE